MKYLFLSMLLLAASVSYGQQSQKLSADSLKYYQSQLNSLWQNAYDSVRKSDRYKALQEKLDIKEPKRITVELLANFGVYFTDLKNLNARLKSIGVEPVNGNVPGMGLSLAVNKPVMTYGFGADAYVMGNKSAFVRGLNGRFFVGTHLLRKSAIVLHPQVGFTFGNMNMFIHNKVNDVEFNDLFGTQANSVQLNKYQTYLDLAMGFKLNVKKAGMRWQFLKAGYRLGLGGSAWEMESGSIRNAPVDKNNQFYLQFCLGFDR